MPAVTRKMQPDSVRYLLRYLHDGMNTIPISFDKLVQVLIKDASFSKSLAVETIHNAITDGILVPHANGSKNASIATTPRSRLMEQKLLRLAKVEEIKESSHDNYCFECHLPGMLEPCLQCSRAFHRLCYRKNADRPNYSVPSVKLQRNRLPAFSSEAESESDADKTNTMGDESEMNAGSSIVPIDQSSIISFEEGTLDSNSIMEASLPSIDAAGDGFNTTNNTSNPEDKPSLDNIGLSDSKIKMDVVCLGEVRPPARKRPATTASNVSYKTEVAPVDDNDIELDLCTCCRLLRSAVLRNPPNLEPDELCYLIQFTFSHNRSWVSADITSFLSSTKLHAKDIESITKFLFNKPNFSLDDIAMKLQSQSYTYIMEFLVDVLDFQHNMGVFFGPNSTELESTKWLVRDLCHDISEIRRCPDCFRHSHEKGSSLWFAKPCLQRHELVYAKHTGFPYWPAKVIRVLNNNKYDVRFFGGDHSRALIDVQYIRPIDTDPKSMKIRNTLAVRKALEELRYHQILSAYPASMFSFHADKLETQRILRAVLEEGLMSMRAGSSARKRRQKISEQRSESAVQMELMAMPNAAEVSTLSSNSPVEIGAAKRAKVGSRTSTPKRFTRSASNTEINLQQLQKQLEEAKKRESLLKRENEKMQTQLQKQKDIIRKHEFEKNLIKRTQWCQWCLQEAVYACCFRASYCSEVCQSRHWKDAHSKVCKNEDNPFT